MKPNFTTKLFLDDEREPHEAYAPLLSNGNPIYLESDWIIARSFMDFMRYLKKYGLPDLISFDHDLGATRDGIDCAHALVEYCLNKNVDLPAYLVHSGNNVGRENILKLLDRFTKFKKDELQEVQEAEEVRETEEVINKDVNLR